MGRIPSIERGGPKNYDPLCPSCGGRGEVEMHVPHPEGGVSTEIITVPCEACGGSGRA